MASCAVVLLVCAAVALALLTRRRRGGWRRLHIVADTAGNEVLLLDARVGAHSALFMLDTAYAGAPVISTSHLSVQGSCAWGSVTQRYRRCLARAKDKKNKQNTTVPSVDRVLLADGTCRAFTSGCTMKLMGIGETVENQSDMLLCPSLVFDGRPLAHDGPGADVLVTNPLPGAPHILTMDYLLHRAPCLVCPGAGRIYFGISGMERAALARTFTFHDVRVLGGAFVIKVILGGAELDMVVDTGAAATVAVSSSSVDRLRVCTRDATTPRSVTQVGVNGERVCSNVLRAALRVGDTPNSLDLGEVDVLANDTPVQGADGYLGMGVLRAVDLWIEPYRLGIRRSFNLDPRRLARTEARACAKGRLPQCAA